MQPTPAPAPPSQLQTYELVLLIVGLASIGVGVFALDWVTYDVSATGLGKFQGGKGLDFDAGAVSLVGGGISGLVGLMGLQKAMSPRLVGSLLVIGALVIAAWALKFLLLDVKDESFTVPGFEVTVEATVAAGGFVTLWGAGALLLSGVVFLFERGRP